MKALYRIFIIFLFITVSLISKDKVFPTPPIDLGYTPTSYRNINEDTYKFKTNNTYTTLSIKGQYWKYNINLPEKEQPQKIKELVNNLTNKGAKILYDDKKREDILMVYEKDNQNKIYIKIQYGWSHDFRILLYYERFLEPQKSIIVEFDKSKHLPTKLLYRNNFDGKHYYYMTIEILEGDGVNIKIKPDLEDTPTKIRYKTSLKCEAKYYKHFGIYDIDPYQAIHDIYIEPIKDKTKAKITLIKTPYKIPSLGKLSTKPGIFKLKNSISSLPVLKPLGNIFGDYDIQGDYLPNKDAIYWLNNGYYTMTKDNLQVNLIPILANHETTVTWPMYFEEMKKKTTSKESNKATTKIAIYDTKSDNNQTVQINLSISHLKDTNLTKNDFEVLEDGINKAKVLSLQRLHEPMNVVILLDSSGSMKKSMKLVLRRVKSFIEQLPDDAKITLVDFDTKVKPIKAKSKDEILKKLRNIKANGATALYDALIKSTYLLKDKNRASVVLFTDGKDANYNDTKRGSKATFEQMIKQIHKSDIPIYPIAFGKGADTTTLATIANMTKTTYYQGDNEESLKKIFQDIANTLSSAYKLTYKRPTTPKNGSQPVVNYMIDTSGSMDLRFTMASSCDGCGYRFEQLKQMLKESIEALPKDTFIQLSTFSTDVHTQQILTKDRAKLLFSIGNIKIGGGTNIIKAVQEGLELSKLLPSDRRYFIFTTDAAGDAFKFDKKQQKELDTALLGFKQNNIQTFWLGMWEDKAVQKHMNYLAKKSNGEAFVSSDINQIRDKIVSITQKVNDNNSTQTKTSSVVIKMKKRDKKSGENIVAVGEKELHLPLLKEDKPRVVIEDVLFNIKRFDTDKNSYNIQNSNKIYGDDIPLKDVRVRKFLTLVDEHNKTISGKNKAIKIRVPKAYIFDRIKGLGASHRSEYLVLDLNITNILPKQQVAILDDGSKHPSSWIGKSSDEYQYIEAIPTYKIPNLNNHLFIRVNNTYEIPFSPLTWALEKPLTQIDEYELNIDGNNSKDGVLLFEIPDKPIKALSLHYYDNAYGHIDLPLIGKLDHNKTSIQKLQKTAPIKLSDAFELSLVSKSFSDELVGIKTNKQNIFEIFDIDITSKLNALLKLNPKERFHLKISTPKGDWIVNVHDITQRVPFGFYNTISLAPGSKNRFSLVFEIPKKLKDYPKSLIVELKGDDKEISINQTPIKEEQTNTITKANAEGIEIFINSISKVNQIDGYSHDCILVDLTLKDTKDSTATRLHDMLFISNQPQEQKLSKLEKIQKETLHKGLSNFSTSTTHIKKSSIDTKTNSRVLGCTPLVLDGYAKRCIVLLKTDSLKKDKPVYLLSTIFTDLKYEIDLKKLKTLTKKDLYLLAPKTKLPKFTYQDEIQKILDRVRHKKLLHAKNKIIKPKKLVSLDSPKELPQRVEPISISYAGAQKLKDVKSLDDVLVLLKSIKWVPARGHSSIYSTESMLTQGWGSEYEMIRLVYDFLKTKNIKIKTGFFSLTDKGEEKLQTMANNIIVENKDIPFIEWVEDDIKHSLVFPFLQDKNELKEFIDISNPSNSNPIDSWTANISIKLYYKKKKTTNAMQIGGMASSLSGTSKEKEQYQNIFSDSFDLIKASNHPLDMWFGVGKNKKGKKYIKFFLSDYYGIKDNLTDVPDDTIPTKIIIEIYDGDKHLDPLVLYFKKRQKPQDIFITLSYATCDLPQEAALKLEEAKKIAFKNLKNIDPLSKLQWINRAKIYKFVSLQTEYENKLQSSLNVNAKRNQTPRVILAFIQKSPDKKLVSSLDLRSVDADVYGDKDMVKAFNFISSIYATEAEGDVIPNSKTVFSLWKEDKNLELLTIMNDSNEQEKAISYLKSQNVPEWILNRLDDSDKVWLFPKNAINNHYGWLEIDPNSLKSISVLDNGQYSAMTETALTQENIETTTRYFLGLLIGSNISVGSVINYSLKGYEDFNEIKEKANKLAKVLGCYVKKFETVASDPIGETKSAVKDEVMENGISDNTLSNTANRLFDCKDAGNDSGDDDETPQEYKDLVNFGKGIDHAISLYFKNMK